MFLRRSKLFLYSLKKWCQKNISIKKLVSYYIVSLLRKEYQNSPIPMSDLLEVREKVGRYISQDPLFIGIAETRSTGKGLNNHFLANQLSRENFGGARITVSSLNFIERKIQCVQPQSIVEFGSGISTICIAHYIRELHGNSNQIYLYSFEQDLNYAKETRKNLNMFGLEKNVKIIHSPLREQEIEGYKTICYSQNSDYVRKIFQDNNPNFVIIDGPKGGMDVRFGTLPLIRPYLTGDACFYLHDALRDWEIKVACKWNKLSYIKIEGVYPVGKGLLSGCFVQ